MTEGELVNLNQISQRTAVVGPDPTVTRGDDGTLTIDWRTINAEPPNLPILCSPEMLQYIVDEHNKHVRAGVAS